MDIQIRNLWTEAIDLDSCEQYVLFQLFDVEYQNGCCGITFRIVFFNFEVTIYIE